MKILPEVQKQELFPGEIVWDPAYRWEIPNETYAPVEAYLKNFLAQDNAAPHAILFAYDEALGEEEYLLDLREDITITSRGAKGAFRALSSLKQLVGQPGIAPQHIHDYPDIANRGLMLDISRGRLPTMQRLRELVDFLADLKYNQLQLYMEAIVFAYPSFPEYTKDTMPITAAELVEFDAYCKERFIDLVPNQNGFGHMRFWLEKPELAHLGIQREPGVAMDTLNPLDPGSVELVDKIYGDLLPNFSSNLFHIGMDEPFSLGKGQTKEICEKEGKGKVYVDYMNQIIRLANDKYHKTPICWDDPAILDPENLHRLSRDMIVATWGYEQETPYRSRCELLREKGHRFYVCPSSAGFTAFTGRLDNAIHNIEDAVSGCLLYGGEGMLMTEWGDGGHPHFPVLSYFSYAFAGICAWNYKVKTDMVPASHRSYHRSTAYRGDGILTHVEQYLDRFVFGVEGIGRILHQMGNYYLLENNPLWSKTCLAQDIYNVGRKKEPQKYSLDASSARLVVQYMRTLREDLDQLPGDILYLKQIKSNCDMVIWFAEFILARQVQGSDVIDAPQIKTELRRVKEEFSVAWLEEAKPVGLKTIEDLFDRILSYIS